MQEESSAIKSQQNVGLESKHIDGFENEFEKIVHKTGAGLGLLPNGTEEEVDQNYQFYKEYCRLYYANIILTNRLQQLLNEKQELQFKLNRLEVRNKLPV